LKILIYIVENPNWFTEVFQKGALYIADELWELRSAGMKANNTLLQHKTFLAKPGHLVGQDGQTTSIVFVTQDLEQIAAFARQLVETTFIVEKLINVGQPNRFHIEVFSGSQTGLKPPISKRLTFV
jgi:zona occludens toxin